MAYLSLAGSTRIAGILEPNCLDEVFLLPVIFLAFPDIAVV